VRFIAGRRDRSAFSLCVADALTGECTTLLTETSDTFVWLNGSGAASPRANPQFLRSGDALWWSERSGYGHLYRVSAAGAAAVASVEAAVVTEIYLCDVCSCQEILRRNGRG
jgi:hypothetical protein